MELQIQIDGLEGLISRMDSAAVKVKEDVASALSDSAGHIKNLVATKAPKGSTGKLAESVNVKFNYPSATVSVDAPYGVWVERGTGLYGPYNTVIQPTQKAVMATQTDPGWGTPANDKGYWIIGIYQRGEQPQPFFEPSVRESIEYVDSRFKQVADNLSARIAEG